MIEELSQQAPRPWYREPWPWALFGLPALTIVAGVITVVLALRSNDGLVEDDYYQQGLAINKTLARDDEAKLAGLHATMSLKESSLRVHLASDTHRVLPDTLKMRWLHPTRGGEDRTLQLTRQGDDYVAELPPIMAGRWKLVIEDPQGRWRIVGTSVMPFAGQIEIHP